MCEIERALKLGNRLGECPRWSRDEGVLFWVDIEGNRFYRYRPTDGSVESFDTGLTVAALGLRASGGLVMATKNGFAFWNPQVQGLTFIADPEPGKPEARFNDGAADRQGRFWAGTLAPGATSSLYRLDPDLTVHTMETGITVSNGIGWSLDDRTMYFTDTRRKTIYAYDFDPATGGIRNRRSLIHTLDEEGAPDGLTVDSEGFIWSARWGGWKLSRYDPSGKLEREIRLPVQYPTSCAFGGDRLDELYVTSARTRVSEDQIHARPFAGDLFRLRAGVSGLPEPKFAG